MNRKIELSTPNRLGAGYRNGQAHRVLILAPVGRDATLLRNALCSEDIDVHACPTMADLCTALGEGAGALIITTEVLEEAHVTRLVECITKQAPWSDVPVLLLATSDTAAGAEAAIRALGNVTVLERPVRMTSLVSAVRTALRARRRQYQVRDLLAEAEGARREAEAQQAHIEALNQRLQRAMTETHHRVKNNLQIIAGMIDMNVHDHPQTVPTDEVRRLGRHVRVLAAVHDLLTQQAKKDGEAHFVSADEMLRSLLPLLQQTTTRGEIDFQLDDAELSARQGTALALILNELVNNALKYGSGRVSVRFEVRNGRASLIVDDDGPGFPEGFDPVRAARTGLELVEHLSRWDLRGETRYSRIEPTGGRVEVLMPVAALGPGQ